MTAYIEVIRSAYDQGYRYFGIRTGRAKTVGTYCAYSRNWGDGDEIHYGKLLSGTSATQINAWGTDDDEELADAIQEAISINAEYSGDARYIVAGERYEYGDDQHEIILSADTWSRRRGAKVIAIVA